MFKRILFLGILAVLHSSAVFAMSEYECNMAKYNREYYQSLLKSGKCKESLNEKHSKKLTKTVSFEECQKMELSGKAKNVCQTLSWGMWNQIPGALQKVVCVGYSSSMCLSGKELDDVALLFEKYPDYLEVAIDKYANDPHLRNDRYAKVMPDKIKAFADEYGIEIETKVSLAPIKVDGYDFYRDNCNGEAKQFCDSLAKKQWNGTIPYLDIFAKNVKSNKAKEAVKKVFAQNDWLARQYYRAYKKAETGPNAIVMKTIFQELGATQKVKQKSIDEVIVAADEYIAYLEDQKKRRAKLYDDASASTQRGCSANPAYSDWIKNLTDANAELKTHQYSKAAVGYSLYLKGMATLASMNIECSKEAKYHLYINYANALEDAQKAMIQAGYNMEPLIRDANEANTQIRTLKREYGID